MILCLHCVFVALKDLRKIVLDKASFSWTFWVKAYILLVKYQQGGYAK